MVWVACDFFFPRLVPSEPAFANPVDARAMITPPRRPDFSCVLLSDSLAAPVRRAARFAGALALAVPFAQGEPDAVRMDFGLQATLRTGASDGMNWVGFHGG